MKDHVDKSRGRVTLIVGDSSRNPPEKMFYFQDVLRLPVRFFISQKEVLSFQNICIKIF
jgi:hypothetical protein